MYEKVNSKNVTISKLFFYIAYVILLFKTICPLLDIWKEISEILTFIEIMLLCMCILIQTRYYKVKVAIVIVSTLFIAVYSYFITNDSIMLLLLLFIYAAKNICLENFMKIDVKLKIVFLCLNIFFVCMGLVENIINYRPDGSIRRTFGFASANSFGGVILSICLELVYINRNRLNNLTYLKIILVTLLLFIFCDSRSSEISLILLCVLLVFYKKKIYLKKILPYLMIIFTILTFLLVYLYGIGNGVAIYLDELFSTRIMIIYNFLNDYNIGLWGNHIISPDIWIGYITTLDNVYAYLIINQGIILYIIIIVINFILMKRTIKDKNNILVAILIVTSIYGLMERTILFIPFNVFMLFARDIFYKKETNELEDAKKINCKV